MRISDWSSDVCSSDLPSEPASSEPAAWSRRGAAVDTDGSLRRSPGMSLSTPAVRTVLAGNAALLVTVLCWGSMAPLMHELLHRYDAVEIAVLRYAVAAPMLLAILASPLGGRPPPLAAMAVALPRLLALGLLGVVVFAPC